VGTARAKVLVVGQRDAGAMGAGAGAGGVEEGYP
jgi:hypothetical protein